MADFDPNDYIPSLINGEYYIPPGTEVFILSGVPLDNTYEHTIVWENLDAKRTRQKDYFLSKVKFGIPKNSYQRVDRFWLKVNINAEYLMDCNYIMFQNTPFNMIKWYYGFITDVEYINNNTSKIRYELDVMQTWLPGQNMDYQPLPCFVERCHAMSDYMFENLIPENIVNTNEYMVDQEIDFDMNDLCVVVATTGHHADNFVPDDPIAGSIINGVYSGLSYRIYLKTNLEYLETILNAYINAGKEQEVVSIQMFPAALLTDIGAAEYMSSYHTISDLEYPHAGQTLGGKNSTFIPKNNKLYSYPYNRIRVNNECGTVKEYKWELFTSKYKAMFQIRGTWIGSCCAVAFPYEYKNAHKNMEDGVIMNSFPVCGWVSDAYKAWWAQNTGNMAVTGAGLLGSILAAGVGIATENPMLTATGVGGMVSSVGKIGSSLYQANHTSTNHYGDTNFNQILPCIENVRFVFTRESLRPEIMQIYDDYFTRFGYAQKKVMYPRLVARKRWTYVQTVGFEFNGQINDTDTKKIKSIFDNGITFWRNPNDVGHYELSNDPLV